MDYSNPNRISKDPLRTRTKISKYPNGTKIFDPGNPKLENRTRMGNRTPTPTCPNGTEIFVGHCYEVQFFFGYVQKALFFCWLKDCILKPFDICGTPLHYLCEGIIHGTASSLS